jgi:hypothetical protein
MKLSRIVLVALAAVIASVAAMGTVSMAGNTQDQTPPRAADKDNPPPRPEWVRSDGTIDRSKAPECVEAVRADGKTMMKGNGEPVCIPFRELHGPPPDKPVDVEKANKGAYEKKLENGKAVMVAPEKRPSPGMSR